MRAVIQRVLQAEVHVKTESVGKIDKGLLIYLSVGKGDSLKDAEFMAEKLVNLRIFADEAGKMNRSALDVAADSAKLSQLGPLRERCGARAYRPSQRPSYSPSNLVLDSGSNPRVPVM